MLPDHDQDLLAIREWTDLRLFLRRIDLMPAAGLIFRSHKPLDPDHAARGRIPEQLPDPFKDLLLRNMDVHEKQGFEIIIVHGKPLLKRCFPVTGGSDPPQILVRKCLPILCQDVLPRLKDPSAADPRQCFIDMPACPGNRIRICLLRMAQDDAPCLRRLARQQVIRFLRKIILQVRLHNGDHISDPVPLIQGILMQNIKKLIHIKYPGRLDDDSRIAKHGHRDQLRPEPAPVAVVIISPGNHLNAKPLAPQIRQEHRIHIDRSVIIFQNTDLFALFQQVLNIFPDKCRFAGSQKTRDQISHHHNSKPFRSILRTVLCLIVSVYAFSALLSTVPGLSSRGIYCGKS